MKVFSFLVEFLKKQWKNLRDSLKRVQEKREEITKSGSAGKPLPSYKYFSQLQFVYDKLPKKETHSNIVITPQTLDRDSPSASSSSSPSSSTFLECPSNSVHATTENTNVSVAANNNVKAKKRKQKNVDSLADEELATTLKKVNQTTELLISKELHGESEDDADTLFCRSIIPTLRNLTPRNNKLAKIKIQQFLFELEFEE